MLRAAIALLVLASPVNDLVAQQFKTIKLKVPAVWKHIDDQGTDRYRSPASDAEVLVDVGHTANPMDAKVCVQKITAASGGEWSGVSIGARPAAKQTTEDKGDDGTVVDTTRYIGCDGKTTWSVEFRVDAHKADRYGPLVDQIIQSLSYL
jgi:hypothetical protein